MKFFCIPLFTCKSGIVEILDYSQLRLEEVPREILKSRKYVEELLLNVNGIEELPAEFFRCTKLRKLDISENKIKVLPPEIGALQTLLDLNLSKNEFVELPEEIGECRGLLALNVSTNIVPGLPKSIINLTSLTHLNVSNNSLTQLPSDIDQLVSLQCLDVGQCELRFLPPSIVRLFNLRILDLCENYLTELPQGMNGFVSLEILDLRSNMITHLPEDILQCRGLRNLDVSCNNISELPTDFGDLENLIELSACDNQLSLLPNSIGRLKKLEILKASKNRISDLTPAICSCTLLTDLILCENQLNELPSSLGNLKRLKFFDANVNNLRYIPTTIGGCAALGVLTLRHNRIQELPMELGRLSKLQVLDVIDNNLTYLPYTLTVLYQSKSLSALWLSFNQPPLPKLSVANEPVMNVKVLTCYLLPQKSENRQMSAFNPTTTNKSCVGGARVCFAKEWAQSGVDLTGAGGVENADEDDEEKNLPIGRFERYDTPHPKPFAPKNRVSRNSGDFANLIATAAAAQVNGAVSNGNVLQNEDATSCLPTPHNTAQSQNVETRPLRSVLKRRPQSVLSQQAVALAAASTAEDSNDANEMFEKKKLRIVKPSSTAGFGWHIVGGADSVPYKGTLGVFISQVNKDSLAAVYGFRADDRLLSINGVDMDITITHSQAVELIKDAGNDFEVVVERQVSSADKQSFNGVSSPIDCRSPTSGNIDQLSSFAKLHLAESENCSEDDTETARSVIKKPGEETEIVAVTISRGNGNALGFSVLGSGVVNDPVIVSALTPGGSAERSGKLNVGDRLLSVNGVNVKSATHDQIVTLLTASKSDIYLVIERCLNAVSNCKISQKPLLSNFNVEPTRRLAASPSCANTTNLCHSRSLPSLAQPLPPLMPELNAPPIPPRTDLFSRNSSVRQQKFERGIAPNRSMNCLLFDSSNLPASLAPSSSAFRTVLPQTETTKLTSPTKLLKPVPPPIPHKNSDSAKANDSGHLNETIKRFLNFEPPLATSSPIPPQNAPTSPTQTTSGSPSHIPVPKSLPLPISAKPLTNVPQTTASIFKSSNTLTSNDKSQISTSKIPPPPVAPKPKIIPEKLNFSSKLKHFEEEISARQIISMFNNPQNGATETRRSGIPMKKPLVSTQDLEKLRAEEANKSLELAHTEDNDELGAEGEDTIHELSKDACFNLLLKNGGSSLASLSGPAVVRTRNAEIRAEKIAAAKAMSERSENSTPLLFSSFEVSASPAPGAPPDETSFSRASSSLSSLEQRAADLEKRQAWRQARLQSMADESKRTDDVIKKLITSIPSSPIPIQ